MKWATWTDRGKSWCLANASFAMAVKQPYAHTPACMSVDSGLFIVPCPSHPTTLLLLGLKQLALLSPTAGNSPGLFYSMAPRGGALLFLRPKCHRQRGRLSPTRWERLSGSEGAWGTSLWLPNQEQPAAAIQTAAFVCTVQGKPNVP